MDFINIIQSIFNCTVFQLSVNPLFLLQFSFRAEGLHFKESHMTCLNVVDVWDGV